EYVGRLLSGCWRHSWLRTHVHARLTVRRGRVHRGDELLQVGDVRLERRVDRKADDLLRQRLTLLDGRRLTGLRRGEQRLHVQGLEMDTGRGNPETFEGGLDLEQALLHLADRALDLGHGRLRLGADEQGLWRDEE